MINNNSINIFPKKKFVKNSNKNQFKFKKKYKIFSSVINPLMREAVHVEKDAQV